MLLLFPGMAKSQFREDRILLDGRRYLQTNKYTQAIITFNKILIYNPRNIEAYLFRGIAKYELSDLTGAEIDFNKVIQLDSFQTVASFYTGILNIERNRFNEAIAYLSRAIRIDDRHPEYYTARGWVLAETGDTAGAMMDFRRAIELNPNQDNAYINLAYLYSRQGRNEEAFKYCDMAIAIDSGNLYWRVAKGNLYQQSKNYELAINQYEGVVRRDSLMLQPHFYLSLCYYELEQYNKSIEKLNMVISGNPNNAVALYYRALAYYALNDYNNSLKDLDLVTSLNRDNIYAYYVRGFIKLNLKDFKGAEADFSRVISLQPLMLDAYRNRSVSRAALSDIVGYMNDNIVADSLLKRGLPEFNIEDLSYIKQITSFRSDFNRIEKQNISKIQYADYEIDIQSIYIVSAEYASDVGYSIREPGLDILNRLFHNDYSFRMKSEQSLPAGDSIIQQMVLLCDSFSDIGENKLECTIVRSLLLSWQQKYQESNELIAEYRKESGNNHLLSFIQGNNYLKLGEIIQSIENKGLISSHMNYEFKETLSNSIVLDYYELAIDSYSTSIKLKPEFYIANYNRATVNFLLSNYTESIFDLTFCIASRPDFGEAYFNRGINHLVSGNTHNACRDLSSAGELGIQSAYKAIYYVCNQ